MPAGGSLMPDVRRLLVAHGLSAIALGVAWPALMVAVWAQTHSAAWLGIAGAARMAPYVLLSWLAGRYADRYPRRLMVRGSLVGRLVLLTGMAVALAGGSAGIAVAFASLAVAAGTPAYPALAAEMPSLAGTANETATGVLVTCEVAAFFVGPALGGALLGVGLTMHAGWIAVATTATALALVVPVTWVRVGAGTRPTTSTAGGRTSVVALLRVDRAALAAMVALVVNNAVGGAVAIGLLPLARDGWSAGPSGYGVGTAALGLGALAVPLLLHRTGLSARSARWAALAMAGTLGAVAMSTHVGWAVVPLVVAGAAAVYIEAVATGVLQERAPDSARSSVLGLADSLMVAAAALSSAVTPWLAGLVGARALLVVWALSAAAMLALFPSVREVGRATAAARVDRRVPAQRSPAGVAAMPLD